MKFQLYLLSPLFLIACGSENPSNPTTLPSEDTIQMNQDTIVSEDVFFADSNFVDVELPLRMTAKDAIILDKDFGDLDKDGVDELVVVYGRDREWESSAPRDFVIYKLKDGEWDVWFEDENVILRADEGGMMGDPFYEGIEIKKGVIHISHNGGSSWKWGNTDKYRYQNGDFYQIGHSSIYGKPCEYWDEVDYNLSTGNCIYTFQVDDIEGCGDFDPRQAHGEDIHEQFNHTMAELPKLSNHRDFSYSFESPKGNKIYL